MLLVACLTNNRDGACLLVLLTGVDLGHGLPNVLHYTAGAVLKLWIAMNRKGNVFEVKT